MLLIILPIGLIVRLCIECCNEQEERKKMEEQERRRLLVQTQQPTAVVVTRARTSQVSTSIYLSACVSALHCTGERARERDTTE